MTDTKTLREALDVLGGHAAPPATSSVDYWQQRGYLGKPDEWREACRLFRVRCSPEDIQRMATLRAYIEDGLLIVTQPDTKTLREAARNALEALESLLPPIDDPNHDGYDARDVRQWRIWTRELRTALAAQAQAEPVAWLYKDEPWFDGNKWHDEFSSTTSEQVAKLKDKAAVALYTAPQPAAQPVAVPDGLSRSDAQFWLDRRGQIIEACQREGYTIVSTVHGVRLMKIGEARAQADAAPKKGA